MSNWYAWKTEGIEVPKPTIAFQGTWKNELGSKMELKVSNGAVTGLYHTAVGAPGNTESFLLVGRVNGDLISFLVDWGKYGSITAWVGQHTADAGGTNERIQTLWQLVKNVAEGSEENSLWGAFLTGSDTFTRGT